MYRKRKDQGGFTLVELTAAMVVAAIILLGSVALLSYVIVGAAKNNDKTIAQLQVQYAGFWVGQDVMRAQLIGTPEGALNLVRFEEADGNITYDFVQTGVDSGTGLALGSLWRTEINALGNSTTLIGENLVIDTAKCCRKINIANEAVNVLVIKVDSKVGEETGNATFEISPRKSDVNWQQCGNCTPDITT